MTANGTSRWPQINVKSVYEMCKTTKVITCYSFLDGEICEIKVKTSVYGIQQNYIGTD